MFPTLRRLHVFATRSFNTADRRSLFLVSSYPRLEDLTESQLLLPPPPFSRENYSSGVVDRFATQASWKSVHWGKQRDRWIPSYLMDHKVARLCGGLFGLKATGSFYHFPELKQLVFRPGQEFPSCTLCAVNSMYVRVRRYTWCPVPAAKMLPFQIRGQYMYPTKKILLRKPLRQSQFLSAYSSVLQSSAQPRHSHVVRRRSTGGGYEYMIYFRLNDHV